MALRFFADHCVSNLIVGALRQSGHTVFRLRDEMPAESPDAEVMGKAQELDAILLSLNGDFADIITYPPSRYKGIVALQIKDHPEITPAVIGRLQRYLQVHPLMADYRGKLIVVEVDRIRVRF
jgi:predicted nuclease of predicted toxin-antitoxin system